MITPFGFRHIGLVRELQSACVQLDPKNALLEEPPTALHAAIRGYLLRSSSGVFTYVLRSFERTKSGCGFAQARAGQAGPAWKVERMAPVLTQSEDAATIW